MKSTIYLALTHDWELWGDGSGDIENIQFAPMRELLRLYDKYGIRTTFTPDVMQQLTFRKFAAEHPELRDASDRWDEHLRDAFRRGHDVQLHLHPQWRNAKYSQGRWSLDVDWSILNQPPTIALTMLSESKRYLEELLVPVDASYRCIAFRAGALAIAPSPYLLSILTRLGIQLDVSVAPGLCVDTRHLKLDYRGCEETVLPFYPRMDDARKISDQPQEITCVPIHCFYASRRQVLRQQLGIAWRKLKDRLSGIDLEFNAYPKQEWSERRHSSIVRLLYDKGVQPYLTGKFLVSDTARLTFPLLREMLLSIRRRARATGQQEVPIVLTNHPKEIRDFASFERFLGKASQADDIRFITLTELSKRLVSGELPVISKRRLVRR